MKSSGGIMKQVLFSIAIMVGLGLIGGNALAENNSNQVYNVNSTVTDNIHYVGNNGTNNTLTIGPSVTLVSAGYVAIGYSAGGKYNAAYVTNAGAVWMATNTATYFSLGENGGSDSNQLTISSGGVVSNASSAYIGNGGSYNRALVTGAGSKWSVSYGAAGQLRIGNNGSYNTLTVDNGGELRFPDLYMSGNGGNLVSNSLVVTNGGKVYATTTCNLNGITAGGSGNGLKVTGGGSQLFAPTLNVGSGASNCTFTLEQGGFVSNAAVSISQGATLPGNVARVTDTGSVWLVNGNMNVNGSNSLVEIRDGGVLTNVATILMNNSYNNFSVMGTGSVWFTGNFYVGTTTAGQSNNLTVAGGGEVHGNSLSFSGSASGGYNNSLVISNGGKVFLTNNCTLGVIITGSGGAGHNAKVSGAGSRLEVPTLIVGATGATNCSFTIEQGGFVSNGAVTVGNGSYPGVTGNVARVKDAGSRWVVDGSFAIKGSNALAEVLNGAKLTNSFHASAAGNILSIGNSGNRMVISDAGTVVDCGNLQIGNDSGSANSELLVTSNAVLTCYGTNNNYGIAVGIGNLALGVGNRMTVSAGAQVTTKAVLGLGQFVNNGGYFASNSLVVTDPGTFVRSDVALNIGTGAATLGNRLVVSNGATLSCGGAATLAANGSGTGNVMVVTGPGSACEVSGSVRLGDDATDSSNRLEISNGARVRMTSLSNGGQTSNLATNNGGIYEFTGATPAIPGPNQVFLTDGTISFYGVTTVDVKGNWTGTLTNIAFAGNNAFRLNNATNAASGQAYTFATGSATNYCRLELLNGSLYQGGAVTIGNGGSLVVSNGTSTISSNLTFASGSTLTVCVGTNAAGAALGALNVGGTLTQSGATLNLVLGQVPAENQQYVIINVPGSSPMPAFSSNVMNVDYGGKTYRMALRYNAGDGNDVAVVYVRLTGTLLKFE